MRTSYQPMTSTWARSLVALCMVVAACICFYRVQGLYYVKTSVSNLSDRAAFEAADLPGFIRQTPDAPKLVDFRQHIAPLIQPGMDETARIVAILHWVRSQENNDVFYNSRLPIVDGTEDPEAYLQQQRRGVPGACRRFSYILTGALLSAGFNARLVLMAATLNRHSPTAHDVVEVWIEKMGKWVLVDPTFDAFVLVDGRPASVLEAYDAAQPGSKHSFSLDQHGSPYRLPPPETYRSYLHHVYVSKTNAVFDGYRYGLLATRKITFVHFAAPGIEPYPQGEKQFLLFAMVVFLAFAAAMVIQIFVSTFLTPKRQIEKLADTDSPSVLETAGACASVVVR